MSRRFLSGSSRSVFDCQSSPPPSHVLGRVDGVNYPAVPFQDLQISGHLFDIINIPPNDTKQDALSITDGMFPLYRPASSFPSGDADFMGFSAFSPVSSIMLPINIASPKEKNLYFSATAVS